MDDPNSVNAIRDLTIAAAGTTVVGNTPCALVPEGYKVEKLDHLLQAPLRKTGVVVFNDLPSFAWYVNAHAEGGGVVYLWREKEVPTFTAVLDDHWSGNATLPGWRQHRASVSLKHSRQWSAWTGRSSYSQADFAEFLEDRVQEVAKPDGAALFELVTNLEASRSASFSGVTKLSNGDVRLSYSTETKAGNGTMEVPQKLQLFIPVWENGPKQLIDVKLRFALREGFVNFKMEVERIEDLIDAAVDEAAAYVTEKTSRPLLRGKIVA